MSFEEMRARRRKVSQAMDATIENMETIADETRRVASVLENASETLDRLDEEFERKTGLTKGDISFLFLAVGLQVARQYLVTDFKKRLNDKKAANEVKNKVEISDRNNALYNPSFDQIANNPVPFDVLNGADGALKGGGIFKHRGATLGHDPILGLIFGTANIATATVTNIGLQSWHVKTGLDKKDCFSDVANTWEVLERTKDKLLHEGLEGKLKVVLSLGKEIEHLRSDVKSKDSLPLPFTVMIDARFASELAKYGFDMANVMTVAKQASYAFLINTFIAILHRMLFTGKTEEEVRLYKVRTRKILMYSNAIAAVSNVIYVNITNNFNKLDIGGIGVALYRLLTDTKFIYEVKKEFVFGRFDKMIEGELLKLHIIDEDFNVIKEEEV